ncbi:MAG: sensor histidine kinase [Oscillospiraceae bacterium]
MSHNESEEELRLLAEALPNVSAQLRSSLGNVYAAFSRIATPERRAEDPELDRQAALLQQNYFRLLRLAGNLTGASRLLDDAPLPLQSGDLTALAEEVFHECLPLAELTGLRLSFAAEEAHLITALNREAVRRILYHLLSNAFKFTPAGGEIVLRCRRRGAQVLLSVEDTGCGISEEQLSLLFDRYLHTERRDPAPYGLGLGLPLARKLAEAHGGQLLMESSPGKGSRATLALPIRTAPAVVRDIPFDYTGGFPAALVELSDALPLRAFLQNPAAQD